MSRLQCKRQWYVGKVTSFGPGPFTPDRTASGAAACSS